MAERDVLDLAIEDAISTPEASELMRQSRRFEDLRESPAWAELREVVKARRKLAMDRLATKLLRGVAASSLQQEIDYARGYVNGAADLVDYPDEVEKALEDMVQKSYDRIKFELIEASEEDSPYA